MRNQQAGWERTVSGGLCLEGLRSKTMAPVASTADHGTVDEMSVYENEVADNSATIYALRIQATKRPSRALLPDETMLQES